MKYLEGAIVVPTEARWIVRCYAPDLTSRSLRGENRKANRRGTLVMPDEVVFVFGKIENLSETPDGTLFVAWLPVSGNPI